MKNIKLKTISGVMLAAVGLFSASCSDSLDLEPIDYYGSGSYWKTEAHISGYIDGIHKNMRDVAWQHTITFGEMRGGHYVYGACVDGSSVDAGAIATQNFDESNTGVSKFGNLYGRITNCNLLIKRVNEATYLSEDKKNYYLAMAHGIRAFYYFDLYRIYGGVPLRLDVEVIEGELDPTKLYMPRANPSDVMKQIKNDIKLSLDYFGNTTDFDPNGKGKKAYWSKAATECLAGEVYLWNAKVTTGDNAANEADLATAKQHLLSVISNYNLKLLDKFSSIFDARNKGNDEIIFAARFLEGEATNGLGAYCYNLTTGVAQSKGWFLEDGTLFNAKLDPLKIILGVVMRYEYRKELYQSFDKEDARRDATFLALYSKKNDLSSLEGTFVGKNIGYVNTSGSRIFCGDFVFYRLAWVYLTLAEIANMEGDNAKVEEYMNIIRQRAYGSNWSDNYKYTAGDFTTNELAILREKDKEFVQEGQRWWDLRRMTLTKGGTHLVFCKEASMDGKTPILNEATEAHKVLWPLDKALLDNDDALTQTPGY